MVGTPATTHRVSAFYAYLLLLVASAALLQASPACEARARRRLRLWRSELHAFCAGELAFGLLTLGLLAWWVADALAPPMSIEGRQTPHSLLQVTPRWDPTLWVPPTGTPPCGYPPLGPHPETPP